MKMNFKNTILLGAGLTLSVALSFMSVACSSSSPVATASATLTTTTVTTTSTTDMPPTTSTTTTAQRPGANGTIAALNGDTLTLTTRSGQVTVNIEPSTTIEETVTGTIADLNQGDFVTVSGTVDSDGNIAAISIMLRQGQSEQSSPTTGTTSVNGGGFTEPGGGNFGTTSGEQFTVGTISSVNGNSFIVATSQSPVTVNVETNTSILKTVDGAASDLSLGDSLSVMGTINSNGDIDATFISVRPQGQGFPNGKSTTTS